MKKLILIIFLYWPSLLSSQEFDVRNTRWGMTYEEVKNSENPLIPSIKKSDELSYENVDLNGSVKCTVIYAFTNGKLIKVRYLIYGPDDNYSRGTCNNIVPFKHKIYLTKFIFDALTKKQMRNDFGWYINGTMEPMLQKLKEGGYDSETINLLDSEVKRLNGTEVQTTYFNKRSSAWITIRTLKENYSALFDCYDDYYNTYIWLVFSPTAEVEAELRKRNF